MTTATAPMTLAPEAPVTSATRHAAMAGGLVVAVGLLAAVALLSVAVGSRQIPLATVWDALVDHDAAVDDHLIIRSLRVPRTLIGLLAGAALGAGGAVMQGVTRNPLADPGLLGVNTGAALFVVIGIYAFDLTSVTSTVWFAFAGAAVASVIVYAIGSLGREGATPVKLALSGAALSAFFGSITTAILLIDIDTLDQFRFWAVGSLSRADADDIVGPIAVFVGIGLVLALAAGPVLNALALGDDVARGLGQRTGMARGYGALCIVLLCGAATAAAGPLVFVGLAVPHVARAITGPDHRWLVPYSIVLAPTFLLAADIVGRIIARPGEVQVGIVTAVIGVPVFIALVRSQKAAEL